MPITGALMNSTMMANLASAGMAGMNLPVMVTAIAQGSSLSILGKPFSTKYTGSMTGPGVGTGVGLILPAAVIANEVYAQALSSGLAGEKLKVVCDAIGSGLEAELKLALLSSTHTPVCIGSGIVDPATIGVVPSSWATMVQTLGAFAGSKWPDFAKAVGNGCASAMKKSSGTVTIVGAPVTPPGPVPGSGTGAGVIA